MVLLLIYVQKQIAILRQAATQDHRHYVTMTPPCFSRSHLFEPTFQSSLHSKIMFGKFSAALARAPTKPAADHNAASRVELYTEIASELSSANVPVSWSDCATCDDPCDVRASDTYPQYVMERYGDLGELPAGFDTDWETELAGSAAGGRGRVVVISTGKSDWERDHFVSHQRPKLIRTKQIRCLITSIIISSPSTYPCLKANQKISANVHQCRIISSNQHLTHPRSTRRL